jgi:orotate phosphoribosyltransferase
VLNGLSQKSELKNELKALLLKLSYEKRDVTLASGEKSDFYFDGKQTSLNARGSYLLGELLYDLVRSLNHKASAVGGPTLGADPLVTAVSLTSFLKNDPIDAFIIRKEPKKHGTGQWIEGAKNLKPGAEVVILEDVVTSGKSSLEAVTKAAKFGLKVLGILCIVDREQGGAEKIREQGLYFASLFTKSELLA